jgi:hypothetical protein
MLGGPPLCCLPQIRRSRRLLGHLQRANPFDPRASERVRVDRKMGKSHPSSPTQIDRCGPADPFLAQMWERIGSARTSARVRACLLVSSPGPPGSDPSCPSSLKFMCHRHFASRYAHHQAFMPFVCASPRRSSMLMPRRPRRTASLQASSINKPSVASCRPHCHNHGRRKMAVQSQEEERPQSIRVVMSHRTRWEKPQEEGMMSTTVSFPSV